MRVVDLTGQIFGKLRVLERAGSARGARWKCLCDPALGGCGNISHVCSGDFRRTRPVRSCGCDRGGSGRFEKVHGGTGTPLFAAWGGIKQRCFNRDSAVWKDYGGRGITLHAPWIEDFAAFSAYVRSYLGDRPSVEHTIDRIENDGHYAPGNLRWATKAQQAQNRRTSKLDATAILFVRHWASRGFTRKSIATAFGIGERYVSQVVHGHRGVV